jgi:hypothetical protein
MGPTQGGFNIPGSKPTMVPPGSQVQMAHPWSPQQPSWRQPLFPMGLLSPQLLPGMQAQIATQTPPTSPLHPTTPDPTGGATTPAPTSPTAPTQPPQQTPQQKMQALLDAIGGGYNAV